MTLHKESGACVVCPTVSDYHTLLEVTTAFIPAYGVKPRMLLHAVGDGGVKVWGCVL
jgi:hypothetical protein